MSIFHVLILAIIQGAAELLPVSSSAHVIVAQKMMGLDPSSPEMVFLLVMLHTGTMFAVLVYFWSRWKARLLAAPAERARFVKMLAIATACTGVLGFGLKILLEKVVMEHVLHYPKGEVELLFKNLPMIAGAMFFVGLLILAAGAREHSSSSELSPRSSAWIGLIQGLCLPFRGFSRSGATISTGLFLGVGKELAEEFSFALAVILTPPVLIHTIHRLLKAPTGMPATSLPSSVLAPGLLGMLFSFAAGLIALRWLSSWIEKGKWKLFGYYCLAASIVILVINSQL